MQDIYKLIADGVRAVDVADFLLPARNWLDPVLTKESVAPPYNPSVGDRYLVLSTATVTATTIGAVAGAFSIWASGGVHYIAGNYVTHNGIIYKCIVTHDSSLTNEPGGVTAPEWSTYWVVSDYANAYFEDSNSNSVLQYLQIGDEFTTSGFVEALNNDTFTVLFVEATTAHVRVYVNHPLTQEASGTTVSFTNAWSGNEGNIAYYNASHTWVFQVPGNGQATKVVDEDNRGYLYSQGTWGLLEEGDLKEFLACFQPTINDFETLIDNFWTLHSIDNIPEGWFQYLGDLVGFEFDPTIPMDEQRRMLKNWMAWLRRKGTNRSFADVFQRLSLTTEMFNNLYYILWLDGKWANRDPNFFVSSNTIAIMNRMSGEDYFIDELDTSELYNIDLTDRFVVSDLPVATGNNGVYKVSNKVAVPSVKLTIDTNRMLTDEVERNTVTMGAASTETITAVHVDGQSDYFIDSTTAIFGSLTPGETFTLSGFNDLLNNDTFEVVSTPAPSWEDGATYIAGNFVFNIGSHYRCILGHTSTVNDAPGSGPAWTTYWEELVAWTLSTSYVIGDYIVHEESCFQCIADHTSSADDEPVDGVNWTMYWVGIHFDGPTVTGYKVEVDALSWTLSSDYTTTDTIQNGGSYYNCLASHVADADSEPGQISTTWSLGVAYLVGDVVNYVGNYYRCILGNTASGDDRPGMYAATWHVGLSYNTNTYVTNGGLYYRCILLHESDSNSEPGVGVDWEDYWIEVDFWTKFWVEITFWPAYWRLLTISEISLSNEVEGNPITVSYGGTEYGPSTAIDAVGNSPTNAWVLGTTYYVGIDVENGGAYYRCILNNVAAASSEPGVGGSWTTYWKVLTGWAANSYFLDTGGSSFSTITPGTPFAVQGFERRANNTLRTWRIGAGYGEDAIIRYTTNVYKAKISHVASTDSQPEQTYPAWTASADYREGNKVVESGTYYRCVGNHTSDASNKPGSGVDWTDYWVEILPWTDYWDLYTTPKYSFTVVAKATINVTKIYVKTVSKTLTMEPEGDTITVETNESSRTSTQIGAFTNSAGADFFIDFGASAFADVVPGQSVEISGFDAAANNGKFAVINVEPITYLKLYVADSHSVQNIGFGNTINIQMVKQGLDTEYAHFQDSGFYHEGSLSIDVLADAASFDYDTLIEMLNAITPAGLKLWISVQFTRILDATAWAYDDGVEFHQTAPIHQGSTAWDYVVYNVVLQFNTAMGLAKNDPYGDWGSDVLGFGDPISGGFGHDSRFFRQNRPAIVTQAPDTYTTWASGFGYTAGDLVEANNGFYEALSNHTSSASDEPGEGVNWATYWTFITKSTSGFGRGHFSFPDEFSDDLVASATITCGDEEAAHPASDLANHDPVTYFSTTGLKGTTGTSIVFDFGTTKTVRLLRALTPLIPEWFPTSFTLEGSNTSDTGPWTAIGTTQNLDADKLTDGYDFILNGTFTNSSKNVDGTFTIPEWVQTGLPSSLLDRSIEVTNEFLKFYQGAVPYTMSVWQGNGIYSNWGSINERFQGRVAFRSGTWYVCTKTHTISIEPGVTPGWEMYWNPIPFPIYVATASIRQIATGPVRFDIYSAAAMSDMSLPGDVYASGNLTKPGLYTGYITYRPSTICWFTLTDEQTSTGELSEWDYLSVKRLTGYNWTTFFIEDATAYRYLKLTLGPNVVGANEIQIADLAMYEKQV